MEAAKDWYSIHDDVEALRTTDRFHGRSDTYQDKDLYLFKLVVVVNQVGGRTKGSYKYALNVVAPTSEMAVAYARSFISEDETCFVSSCQEEPLHGLVEARRGGSHPGYDFGS